MLLTVWSVFLVLASLLVLFHPGGALNGAVTHTTTSRRHPRVGLVVPVHPPKFSYIARFLEQYAACPAARQAMMVVVVFSNQKDSHLFWQGLSLSNRTIPPNSFTSLVSDVPDKYDPQIHPQYICSWKKYYGIAYLMDLENAPEYGIIADSELRLYDEHDCGSDSKWNMLFERIQGREKKREWNAIKVNETDRLMEMDVKGIMNNMNEWLHDGNTSNCVLPNCQELKFYYDHATFSWWTDLPWINLKVVSKMFTHVAHKGKNSTEKWTSFVRPIHFSRYDHIAYQYWTILHEGFNFMNVTNITGKSVGMSTYLEGENRNNSRLADLYPLWIGEKAYAQTLGPTMDRRHRHYEKIQSLSSSFPPLLIFHTDMGHNRTNEPPKAWEERVNSSHDL